MASRSDKRRGRATRQGVVGDSRWAARAVMAATVFLLAMAVRGGWAWHLEEGSDKKGLCQLQFPDEQEYWWLGASWRAGGGMMLPGGDQAKRMPLYPAMLSVWMSLDRPVLGARLMGSAFGAVTAVLMGFLGWRLGGAKVGWLAGLAVATDMYAIFFSSLLLTETVFIAALCGLIVVGWPWTVEGVELSRRRLALGAMLAVEIGRASCRERV